MKLKNLLEEHKATIKKYDKTFEIFANPSRANMRDLRKEENLASWTGENLAKRFIVDFKGEKIYVFSAELLHSHVAKELNIPYGKYLIPKEQKFYFGDGEIKGRKIIIDKKSELNLVKKMKIKEMMEMDWLSKYLEFV